MKHILIIEDDTSIAELERDYLEANEITSEIVPNGELGLQKALHQDYDLILLDVMLPGMDGFSICRTVREQKNIPILLVSARREDIDKIRGLGLGADDYISKPFNILEVKARIRAIIRRSMKAKRHKKEEPADKYIGAGDLKMDTEGMSALSRRGHPIMDRYLQWET